MHLGKPIKTVTDKPAPPPGGTINDYWSLSPYWWPTPDSPDGLPYVQRDGELNPEAESDKFDRVRFFTMGTVITESALAYRITGDERYAACASRWARAWFIEPATRMNPSLNFAQSVPGKEAGSRSGIIRGMTLLEVHEALGWLERSKAWTAEDAAGWKAWTTAYLDWLLESELGQGEAKALNNHGTWYDVQVVTFAIGADREALIKETLEKARIKRIRQQIKPDGRQPFELMRTKSWDYSVMNLLGMVRLADLAATQGVDLWNYESSAGTSLKKAIAYLLPFALGEAAWEGKQIKPFDPQSFYPVLRPAALALAEPAFVEGEKALRQDHPTIAREHFKAAH